MVEVLYEDNHLIAVWKPARMPTQPDASGDISLMDEVKKYLKRKYAKRGNVFLGLVHRLDRPVSGIILLAKTSKAAARLSEQFKAGEVKKIYYALLAGHLPRNGVLVNYLIKDRRSNNVVATDSEREGSVRAELSYERLRSDRRLSLARVRLKTGRAHQIRVQFAHIGHPIIGDKKYGCFLPYRPGEIALIAAEITFWTVAKKEMKTISKIPRFRLKI